MPQSQSQSSVQSLFAKYTPPVGVYDEAVAADGVVRPAWKALASQLDEMGDVRIRERWTQAQAQIERNGITFNPYEDEGMVARPWTLDAIPMVVTEAEWNVTTQRLDQRARVLEALLQDLFGKQRLLKERIIPPDLVFGHPGWFPAYQNLQQPNQRYLTYCVTDLARAPDGQWWATGDRTRSPFGLGYVLENRITTSRMLPKIFHSMPIRRLAGFYATLKDELRKLAPGYKENPRIVLWSKGPQSRHYFEDSYLARYLGYTLAEGEDLAVRADRVQLLTLGGIRPVEVLLRRMDDDDCDSVELNPHSRIGISALLDVMRAGKVAVANSIGSRLVESPAFMPFLQAVSRHLLGEDLQIPSVATWWCGAPKALSHVLANLDKMLIRPAFRIADVRPIVTKALSADERADLIAKMKAHPSSFVGQEMVDRSTTPVLTDSGVQPWYVGLRAFLVNSDSGFQTLPGGLARVSADSDSLNFTMTAGERSQDVWILSDSPVEQLSLLEAPTALIEPHRSGAELPSRVADNFFWLGRYAERASQTVRILRTLYASLESEDNDGPETVPLLRMLALEGQIDPDHVVPELSRTISEVITALPECILDRSRSMSLRSTISSSLRTAMKVRDRISVDMWQAIDRLDNNFDEIDSADLSHVDIVGLLEELQGDLAALTGLVAESMTRTLGWRFLMLGSRLERTWQTCRLLKSFFVNHQSEDVDTLESVLTASDSLMTYRVRYLSTYQVPVVLDLLLTDTTNPRSVIYQLNDISDHLDAMPDNTHRALLTEEKRRAVSALSSVQLADIYQLSERNAAGTRIHLQKLLDQVEESVPKISESLTSRFLIHAGLPRHFGTSS